MKLHAFLAGLLVLAACSDPMQSVERLGEVELAEGVAAASVLPSAGDSADAPLVLDQLLAGTDAATSAETPVGEAEPEQPPARQGFWAQFQAPANANPAAVGAPRASSGPDALQVAAGTLLPYGQIATVCGQPEAALGTPIATGSGYVLHDSAPTSTALRPHYLTGFPDGCARIFSAALVLFGDIGTHEMIRYMPASAHLDYSASDAAYEQVKAQFCGVPQGQPCGGNLDRLDAHSTFVTIYETFGTNEAWGEIFLHQGQVLAIDVRHG